MLKNLEEKITDKPRLITGMYLLYSLDRAGFEKIKTELSGNDYFFHNISLHPKPSWIPSLENGNVHIWLHFYPVLDHISGASKILDKMSPDRTGEMKFLKAFNTGISLTVDEKENYISHYDPFKGKVYGLTENILNLVKKTFIGL